MPLPGSAESGWRNEVDAASTCTRFWRAGIEPAISDPVSGTDERFSPLKPTPELLRVSEQISRDCSSLEWIGGELEPHTPQLR